MTHDLKDRRERLAWLDQNKEHRRNLSPELLDVLARALELEASLRAIEEQRRKATVAGNYPNLAKPLRELTPLTDELVRVAVIQPKGTTQHVTAGIQAEATARLEKAVARGARSIEGWYERRREWGVKVPPRPSTRPTPRRTSRSAPRTTPRRVVAGRAPRGRRARVRTSPARSPGRQGDDPEPPADDRLDDSAGEPSSPDTAFSDDTTEGDE